jgi:hypothetical protein
LLPPTTVIDLLTSDPAILVMSAVGLAATAVSILRDARAQRARAGQVEELPLAVDKKLAA